MQKMAGALKYELQTVSLFICMLYLFKKDIIQAEKWMHTYCQALDKEDENSCYYFCYELMLHLKNQNSDDATIYNYLRNFSMKILCKWFLKILGAIHLKRFRQCTVRNLVIKIVNCIHIVLLEQKKRYTGT